MPTVQVLVKKENIKDIVLPEYQRQGDAGLDLRSAEEVTLKPGERYAVGTGLRIALPEGVVGIIKDRSGLALNFGIHTLAGVIDSNYRGEVKVVLVNSGEKTHRIKFGDRIAQLILLPCLKAELIEKKSLPKTERNEKGFGSSGVK